MPFLCVFFAIFIDYLLIFRSLLRFASASIASIYPSKPLPEIVLIA